jgi:hypothetical protein
MNVSVENLIANGFNPVTYDGQDGTFYAKRLAASSMPNFYKNVVDNEIVFDSDDIVVEVCPNWCVQLVDQDSDYFEEGVPVDSPEGHALLIDAGFVFI